MKDGKLADELKNTCIDGKLAIDLMDYKCLGMHEKTNGLIFIY